MNDNKVIPLTAAVPNKNRGGKWIEQEFIPLLKTWIGESEQRMAMFIIDRDFSEALNAQTEISTMEWLIEELNDRKWGWK